LHLVGDLFELKYFNRPM